ncbi:MAG: alpha-amylase family protein [Chloroflexota bacterium]
MSDQWWLRPFRVFQTNIREIDAGLDVEAVLDDIVDFGANTWLLNAGGIVSFYPSRLPFQHPSPWLRERVSGDLLGDAVGAAHKRGVRVLARCDFSKVHQDIYERHPDWCYISPAGAPQIYNGLYSCCPNAPYYQEKAFEIISEILDRYAVDGFFFNMFNHPLRDYSGVYHGLCQCAHCHQRFNQATGLQLPSSEDWNDPAYLAWREWSRSVLHDLAGRVRELIKTRRPDVALVLRFNPDVTMNEVNNAIDRPLPLWRQWAGEFGRQARTAFPGRPAVCNGVMFLDFPYRFTAEQPGLNGLHLAQMFSHGVNPWSYVIGTTRNQPDRKNFPIVRRMNRFHRDNEDVYAGLAPDSRVAIIESVRSEERIGSLHGGEEGVAQVLHARRGAYRALCEMHVPFDIFPDDQLVAGLRDGRLSRYAALVLPNVAVLDEAQAQALDDYVAAGGGLVATYETGAYRPDGSRRSELALKSLGASRILSTRAGRRTIGLSDVRGISRPMRAAYLKVTRREDLPGFDDTDWVMLDRAFLTLEVRAGATPSLTLIPQSRSGPPEKIYVDHETDHPGLLHHTFGKGRTAYFPWPVDALFFDHSLPEHRALLAQAVVAVAGGRQVETDARPQVEVVVGRLPDGAAVVHLINHSGHQDRSYHEPVPMHDIALSLAVEGPIRSAHARVAGTKLAVSMVGSRASFTVPRLDLMEVVVLRR